MSVRELYGEISDRFSNPQAFASMTFAQLFLLGPPGPRTVRFKTEREAAQWRAAQGFD
jgi:hypothetical protein